MEITQTSFPQLAIAFYLRKVFPVVLNYLVPNTNNRTVDIFIPDLNLTIEYDGVFYHRDRLEQDEEKSFLVLNHGIDLLRLRDVALPDIQVPGVTILKNLDQNVNTLAKCIKDLLQYLQGQTGNYELTAVMKSVDLKRDGVTIRGSLAPVIKKRNARDAGYDFLDEWHSDYNSPILPEHVSPKSNADYWWECGKSKEHVWPASFGTRSKGHGCPFCAGQRPDSSNSLGALYPALAAEWSQGLNGDITPFMILPSSNKLFWWSCPVCTSDYDTRPNYRLQGEACPYCAGKRVNNTNSLATKYPALAAQWHPEKNGSLTPHMVTSGSSKRVWWQCSKEHEWDAVIYSRKQRGCRQCYIETRGKKRRRRNEHY
jgi:hypothetical protein